MLSSIFSIFIYSQQFPKDPVTCILYRGICVSMTFSFLSALSWFISNQYQCFLMHFSIYHTRESYGVSDHIIWQHYRLWFRLHRLIDFWALTTFHREFLSILTIRLLLLLLFLWGKNQIIWPCALLDIATRWRHFLLHELTRLSPIFIIRYK